MRIRNLLLAGLVAPLLAGCNDSLESIDISKVSNKVEYQLSGKIVEEMRKKGMAKTSPIMLRILKEEGMLEVWKARTDQRFEKLVDYKICAWSGRLGPKIKEGDRQAPEGFYELTQANLNPNSKYYLAINTGFPNNFDRANGRYGTNLMIHGACSSSGCYSMTDEQVLEIYALARDAFRGGQKTVQLQALPFRMTAENMARHRLSPHYDFWKMLKVGYDNFEVTKRPPEVAVCNKSYVFNQDTGGKGLNPRGTCPAMSTPPALAAALQKYNARYDAEYQAALKKFDDKVWYDPTEAERKAVVANLRKGKELAYAPTGTALEAGKLVSIEEYQALLSGQGAKQTKASVPQATAALAAAGPSTPAAAANSAAPAGASNETTASVPVPMPNPNAPVATAAAEPPKKPFWKFWASE
ncbi:L,D-transpeptidase family protein [Gellertiella hungarica]|uniref:Murein L,D-transpeptidase YafK n=1 Tax=Gellertiella hungarica TaxID=1572859 RepID=A0A7W6NK78_9HYPH|nr:murein L,D-transpeptidase family protein [Gellertiella hungarica]MBB4065150.1 murein L,D-transpeptidase YafK [Gellertiella hungarica]